MKLWSYYILTILHRLKVIWVLFFVTYSFSILSRLIDEVKRRWLLYFLTAYSSKSGCSVGINLRFFKIRFIFHAGLFRPIVGYRRRALYVFCIIFWLDTHTHMQTNPFRAEEATFYFTYRTWLFVYDYLLYIT